MLNSRILSLLLGVTLISSSAVATPAFADEEKSTKSSKRVCLNVNMINGFRVIDDWHLTVSTGVRHNYLITTSNRCRDLRRGYQMAIKSHGTFTCSNSRDTIIPIETGDYGITVRCYIKNIEKVESHSAAKKLVEEREDA